MDFPSHSKEWKKFEQNNKTIAQISYLHHTILNKKDMHTNQNIILSMKIK